MTKVSLTNPTNVVGAESTFISTLATNNDAVEAGFENTLSRDGASPNSMQTDLDMDGNDILNAGQINADAFLVDGVLIGNLSSDGWSPEFAVVTDSTRRVLQVVDWTGGTTTKPDVGEYVGPTGFVATAAEAVDIRGATGAAGADGDGSGDMTQATYDSNSDGKVDEADVADAAPWAGITGKPTFATVATSGSYTDLSSQPTIPSGDLAALDEVSFSDIASGALASSTNVFNNSASKLFTTNLIEDAAAFVTLTDATNVVFSWTAGVNRKLTLGGNRTLANPTGGIPGQSRWIVVIQDGTGTRTLSYGTQYKGPGGTAPVLSTGAGDIDILQIFCYTATEFWVFPVYDISAFS